MSGTPPHEDALRFGVNCTPSKQWMHFWLSFDADAAVVTATAASSTGILASRGITERVHPDPSASKVTRYAWATPRCEPADYAVLSETSDDAVVGLTVTG